MSTKDDPRTPLIPLVYRTADGRAITTDTAEVQQAGGDEMALYHKAHDVCGTCKYFEHGHGQQQMLQQRFVERLVREDNWQVKHLVSPTNELGVCGAHDSGRGGDQLLTGTMHKACDQYRPARGGFSLRKERQD